MRVLHIVSSLAAGGAEVYVGDLSQRMVAQGHEISVAYVSDAASMGRSPDFEAGFKAFLDSAGVRHVAIGHDCRRRFRRGGLRLRRIVDEFEPDVVHSHLYYGLFFMAFAFMRVPLVYTHHNHHLGKGRYLYAVFNRIVDRYVSVTRRAGEILQAAGARPVTTIYNGVSPERLLIKKAYHAGRCITMLAIGRPSRQKNFGLIIQALDRLLGRRPEWRGKVFLRIVGEGPLRSELTRQVERAGLADSVSLLGDRRDVAQLLHEADLFVISSDYEGLPIALLEALMTGVPAVVTDVGGCREVVEECRAGVVVPPRDAAALCGALEYMLDNPVERTRMSASARQRAQRFAISHACNQHLSLYASLPCPAGVF